MEVDKLTGRPIERNSPDKEIEREKALENQVSVGMEMERKLNTTEGIYFIGLMKQLLEDRIMQLVSVDVQCQSLLQVLTNLGADINAGRMASERLVRSRLRREGRTQF